MLLSRMLRYGDKVGCESASFDQVMRENILRYMDRVGYLERLEIEGLEFKQCLLVGIDGKRDTVLPSFTSTVYLDLSLIVEVSGRLGLLLLEEPQRAQLLFRDVVHCSLVTLCSLPTISLDQVQVLPRVSSLVVEGALKTGGMPLPDPTLRRLLLLQGVVASVTTPTKYTRSAVFRCLSRCCAGSCGFRVWGCPGSPGLGPLRRRCRLCGADAEEAPRSRDVGDHMLAVLIEPEALKAASTDAASIRHPMLVRFSDDLARPDTLLLGSRYDVIILTAGASGIPEAWGVRPWKNGAHRRVDRGLRSDPLPASIQTVWVETSADTGSPWAFAVSLASHLGGEIYPPHTFLHLKLGILLSLASQALEHQPVALLAAGPEPAGRALMERCARLADRGVRVTLAADFGKLNKEVLSDHKSLAALAGAWHSASHLVLAQGGVCLLGCWDKWSRSSAALSITSALESGKAVVLESKDLAGAKLPSAGPSVTLQCAVWTYWSPSSKTKMSDVLTLRTLLNTLGAPALSVCCESEAEDVCNHLLQNATGGQIIQSPVISEDEMSEFLRLVNAQPVALTEEASRLIQDYFVASRRARPNCLPVTAIGTMAGMAEALARISLRMETTWADVVFVVWMYETALTSLFGPCLISPLPDICGQPLSSNQLMTQMDSRLESMRVWLDNFTKSILLSGLRF